MKAHRFRILTVIAMALCAFVVPRILAEDVAQVEVGGTNIAVIFTEPAAEPLQKLVIEWVRTSARAVSTYYERFPVARAEVRVRLHTGRGARNGTTYGWRGAFTTISVGRASTAADFAEDWLLTHELVHMGFPSVPNRHHWIEEGLATYVESIARARAGGLSQEKAWRDLFEGMPQGLPQAGDRGLDFTPTWGRTYWGGAIFCLLADVEIRKRTENRYGLEHALRAIVKAGGTIESEWELSHAIEIGDRATGVPVLQEFYDKMKAAPVAVPLDDLWAKLGIATHDGRIVFDDSAPLAYIRKAITQPVRR
jgi:hypothetical protein